MFHTVNLEPMTVIEPIALGLYQCHGSFPNPDWQLQLYPVFLTALTRQTCYKEMQFYVRELMWCCLQDGVIAPSHTTQEWNKQTLQLEQWKEWSLILIGPRQLVTTLFVITMSAEMIALNNQMKQIYNINNESVDLFK